MSSRFPKPPFPEQQQPMPGKSAMMDPPPDYGEESYGALRDSGTRRPSLRAPTAASAAPWRSPLPAKGPISW